jgi:hypothetical protein
MSRCRTWGLVGKNAVLLETLTGHEGEVFPIDTEMRVNSEPIRMTSPDNDLFSLKALDSPEFCILEDGSEGVWRGISGVKRAQFAIKGKI